MTQISPSHVAQIAETVSSQIALIDSLRYAVTEAQADSHNQLEQDALQAELDHLTEAAGNLNRALLVLAA